MKPPKKKPEFQGLPLKLNVDSVSPHILYFKEHSVREQRKDKPQGRTLFIVNVPPYADETGIANAFSKAGLVKNVQLCLDPNTPEIAPRFVTPKPNRSFKVGYVVFSTVAALHKALRLTELQPMNSETHEIKVGLSKWVEEYNNAILLPSQLQKEIDTYMLTYDEESKKAKEKEKKLEEEDDEGWVTVTRGGKVQSFARSENVENKIMEKEEKNKGRKELKNFYTFQIRESKMKEIVSLRQKFEEDKKKIAQIKQTRRFKPF